VVLFAAIRGVESRGGSCGTGANIGVNIMSTHDIWEDSDDLVTHSQM
jgi:hypothetical protein